MRRRWLQVIACSACLACSADGDWREASSSHFDYWTRPDSPACPNVLGEAERHYTWTHAYLGLDPTERVSYYKYRDSDDFARSSPCSELFDSTASGCAGAGSARAYTSLHEHELVHAYTLSHWRMPRFINEGLAVASSCPIDLPPPAAAARWQDLVGMDDLSPAQAFALYYPAGQFVAALLHQSGASTLARLIAAYPFDAPESDLPAVFADVTGQSIDAFWNAIVAAGPSAPPCDGAWQCDLPIGTSGGVWVDECSPYRMVSASASALHVTTTGASFTSIMCGSGVRDAIVFPTPSGNVGEHWVVGGVADVTVRPNANGTLTAAVVDAWATSSCGAGPTLVLAPDHPTYFDFQATAGPLYVNVGAPNASTSYFVATASTGTIDFAVCDACGGSQSCQTVDAVGGANVVLQGPTVLRIGAVLPSVTGGWLTVGVSP